MKNMIDKNENLRESLSNRMTEAEETILALESIT